MDDILVLCLFLLHLCQLHTQIQALNLQIWKYYLEQRRRTILGKTCRFLNLLEKLETLHLARQRKRLLKFISKQTDTRNAAIRSIWVQPRPTIWWDDFDKCDDDLRWRMHFRMSKGSFDFIVRSLKPYMEKMSTNWRKPIPVRKRVAASLWRLASGCEYRTVQELFGIGKTTCCSIFLEFLTAMCYLLKKRFIKYPTPEECEMISAGFEEKWGFPNCIGAIDATHIPIIAPETHRNDYYNRKGWYSILCQAVCDHRYLFWDLDIGWPGRVHDARVFANSTIYERGMAGRLFPTQQNNLHGVQVPYLIIADPAYPLQKWLMKPFRETVNTPEMERHFNYRLSRARMVIECTFGRLKGRWRCIMKRNDTNISMMPHLVMTCAILHNICELRGEVYEDDNTDHPLIQPVNPPVQDGHVTRGTEIEQAKAIRNAIKLYLSDNRL